MTSLLKTEILNTPGVIELVDFVPEYEETSRQFSLTFSARAEDGVITITNLILGEIV